MFDAPIRYPVYDRLLPADRQTDVFWHAPWPLALGRPMTLIDGLGSYQIDVRIGTLYDENGENWVWEAHNCGGATYRRLPPHVLLELRAILVNEVRTGLQ